MKKRNLIGLLLITLIFNACQFNQSVNKDVLTGAYSRGDGLGCDGVKILINGKIENRNKFVYGEKINFVFNDISGFSRENGKAFPGLSLFIINNKKDTVVHHQDLFSDMKSGTDLSPLQLSANFVAVLPYKNNEKYQVFANIWDKKGEGTFQYELPFSINENEVLKIEASNIDYKSIYLWDNTENSVLINKKVNKQNALMLILQGLDGLEIKENKVFPSLSIEITDTKGNKILSKPNILQQYSNQGLDYDELKKGALPITISFSDGQMHNPCQIKASLTDLNSNGRIDIIGEIEIK